MYRITRTDFERKGQQWQGFCAVVELGEMLTFPNSDTYKYKRGDKLKILEGPHRGTYLYTYLGKK